MPLYESFCPACDPAIQKPIEHYYSRSNSPMCECETCGLETKKLISGFAVVFCGVIVGSKYGDKSVEGNDTTKDGHWAWRRRSGKNGKPEKCQINTFQEQREFCKAEGLVNPKDIGPMEVHSDGVGASTRGMPGAW